MQKVLIILLVLLPFYGCNKDSFKVIGDPVNLMVSDDPFVFSKTVILYDDNDYLVKTPLDSFVIGHPFNTHEGYYNSYKAKAIEDSRTSDVLKIYDYMSSPQDTVYALAYHLEKGSCYMWDKKAKKSVKIIYVEEYYEGQPMAGHGGRRFYIRDNLFLATVDWISK